MITVNASRREPICLRHQGENDAMRVAFPLSAFEADWPGGTPLLLVQRPRSSRDAEAYPVALSVDGHTAYWTVSASDIEYSGYGKAQLQWRVEDVLVKSCIYDTVCVPSLHAGAEPPDGPSKRWFDAIQAQIGDLSKLTTKAKDNLVAAINEAARSGGGSGGAGTIDMRVADGYIQYSNDDGATWENLIAIAELKGADGKDGTNGTDGAPGKDGADGAPGKDGVTPTIGENGNWYLGTEDTGKPSRGATGPQGADGKDGTNGTDGTDGHTPVITASKSGKVTTIKVDGEAVATVNDGADGTNGTDGAPGKDGADGAPGKDGITPTIGENGNWYLGDEDTGKPSRGATGQKGPAGDDYVLTPADKTQIAEEVIAGGQEVQVGEPLPGPTDAQVNTAVNTWLADHPEATTTVQDGAVTVEKLGYGKHIYGSKPYFCGAVGTGAQVYGSIGVVVPCKAGDTIYCTFNMSPNGAYQKPQLLAALPENQYGAIAPIGTIEKDDTTKAYTVPESATTAKAMYLPQSFNAIPAANNGSVEDALAWINKTMGTDGKWCAQNVPFTELDAWYQTEQAELFDIDESCNKLMYASLYQAVSKLVGAKVAVLGDSLTEQSACSFITSAYNDRWMENVLRDTALTGDDGKTYKGSGWFAMIARKYKIKWWCAGHGAQWWYSTTERPNGATAMVRKLIDGTDEFDYIVLEYGTNDILSGYTHIGTAADEASETATTSCGAIKWCIEQLQTRFPEASIVVILPNIRSGANGEAPATQQAYLDAVVPILKQYGVRRVNMAEDSGIVKSMMYTDGIHLRKVVVSGGKTYYTNDSPAVRKYSKCLESVLLQA